MRKLLVLGFVVVLGSGCVSRGAHKRAIAETEEAGKAACVENAVRVYHEYNLELNRLNAENAAKTDRLRRFNQVDADGRLRPLSQERNTRVIELGEESWQK